jgi:hypothetical protein
LFLLAGARMIRALRFYSGGGTKLPGAASLRATVEKLARRARGYAHPSGALFSEAGITRFTRAVVFPSVIALDTQHVRRQSSLMAQSILIYDFGTNEEAAQQARHKIESWQQGLRLGKKVLVKFDRKDAPEAEGEAVTSASTLVEKPSAAKPARKKAEGKSKEDAPEETDTAPSASIRLMVRLGFSDHEKLVQQRVLDRFTSEEPFKSAKGETIRQGSPAFGESAELFDNLD